MTKTLSLPADRALTPARRAAFRPVLLLGGAFAAVSAVMIAFLGIASATGIGFESAIWVRCSLVLASAVVVLAIAASASRGSRAAWVRLRIISPVIVVAVAADLKARLLRQVAAGNDVVLDFGFWFRRQRDEFRALLAPQGIVPETVYIATSLETILSRVGDRHGRQADDWPLTAQTATEYFERFEPPTPEEGPLEVVR